MFLVLKTVLLNDGHHLSVNYYLKTVIIIIIIGCTTPGGPWPPHLRAVGFVLFIMQREWDERKCTLL